MCNDAKLLADDLEHSPTIKFVVFTLYTVSKVLGKGSLVLVVHINYLRSEMRGGKNLGSPGKHNNVAFHT